MQMCVCVYIYIYIYIYIHKLSFGVTALGDAFPAFSGFRAFSLENTREISRKLEKTRENSRKLEKTWENSRKLEKLEQSRESSRQLEKSRIVTAREILRKLEKYCIVSVPPHSVSSNSVPLYTVHVYARVHTSIYYRERKRERERKFWLKLP